MERVILLACVAGLTLVLARLLQEVYFVRLEFGGIKELVSVYSPRAGLQEVYGRELERYLAQTWWKKRQKMLRRCITSLCLLIVAGICWLAFIGCWLFNYDDMRAQTGAILIVVLLAILHFVIAWRQWRTSKHLNLVLRLPYQFAILAAKEYRNSLFKDNTIS